jgi:HlyD family secretion protein
MRSVALAALAAALALAPRALKKKPLAVTAIKVERATVLDEVASSSAGEVVAKQHATVRAELAARVVAVKHKRGERVKRGDVIVALDDADLQARLQQAQATLAAQSASYAQAQARAASAKRSSERARVLAEKGAGTTQLSDDAAAAQHEADEAVHAAAGIVQQAEAALKVARVARSKAELTAPFDGLLVEVTPDPGEELSPGAPVFEIIDDSKLHVEAPIDEADIGRVKVGQPATLSLDALPGQAVKGVVSKIAPAVRKDLKGARTLPIEVEVTDAAAVRSGMSADVNILVAEKKDVPSLPTSAIVGRGAKRTVYKIEGGTAKLHDIKIGLSNWERCEVVDGVALGDEVIGDLNVKGLEDGVPVKAAATTAK